MVPQPVKAVILLFPIDEEGEARRKEEDARIAREGQPKIDNTIFFIKQTVGCLLFKLVRVFCNFSICHLDFKRMWNYRSHPCSCQRKCHFLFLVYKD